MGLGYSYFLKYEKENMYTGIDFITFYRENVERAHISVAIEFFHYIVTKALLPDSVSLNSFYFNETRTSLISVYDLLLLHMVNEDSVMQNYRDEYEFIVYYDELFDSRKDFNETKLRHLIDAFANKLIYGEKNLIVDNGHKIIDPSFIGKLQIAKMSNPEIISIEEMVEVINLINLLMEYWLLSYFHLIPEQFKIYDQ